MRKIMTAQFTGDCPVRPNEVSRATVNSNIQYETNKYNANTNTMFSSFHLLFCQNYLVHGYVTKSEGPWGLESSPTFLHFLLKIQIVF